MKNCKDCKWWQFMNSGLGTCNNHKSFERGRTTVGGEHTCSFFEPQLSLGEKFEKFNKLDIPAQWSFKNEDVANHFDEHVREQLPFYDLTTQAVVHVARHYVPHNGLVYDIGAATGNITMALADVCFDRFAKLYSIEESAPMLAILNQRVKKYCDERNTPQCYEPGVVEDALKFKFEQYDFAVCFLTFMFFPVTERKAWLANMRSLIKPGGCLLMVEKIITPSGYVGTVLRRLAMDWKLKNGADPEAILKKELSLAGYQRPVDERMLEGFGCHKFFQLGEFAGWILERTE